MKILHLRFKNLNSLVGEWDIDFSHPDYVSSGIFAITGPTGAGKTTILDAICVALYGQTPRLSKLTQSENEIMSRQSGECFAEVEFSTAKGHFRCHWSQHRSRKQAGGQLQAPKHEIVAAGDGTILESKLSAVARKVEEVTGMDFDRFTRSMLLAQGGFAVFLQSTPDKRAPILEQITGTAIYSQISIKVHECTAEERKKLADLRLELAGMQLLSAAEIEALHQDQHARQEEERVQRTLCNELAAAQAWKERIVALESELTGLQADWRAFEGQKLAAAPELALLAAAGRAQSLEGDYAHLAARRNQQREEERELQGAEKQLPQAQQQLLDATAAREQAELGLKAAQAEQQREAELIRRVRILDVQLAATTLQVQGLEKDLVAVQGQCRGHREFLSRAEAEQQQGGANLAGVVAFLDEHGRDAGLVEALTGMEEQLKRLHGLYLQLETRREELRRQAEENAGAKKKREQAEVDWQAASSALAAAKNRHEEMELALDLLLQGRDLSGWRQAVETLRSRLNDLEQLKSGLLRMAAGSALLIELQGREAILTAQRGEVAGQEESLRRECSLREEILRQCEARLLLLNRVRDLEEERLQLVDGAPCPLCGALEHPYALGNLPQPDGAAEELSRARAESKGATEQLATLRLECAGINKELEQIARELRAGREQAALDQAAALAACSGLALASGISERDAMVDQELSSCRTELAYGRELLCQAEAQGEELLRIRRSVDTAKEALNQVDRERQVAEFGWQSALKTSTRLEQERQSVQADFDLALAAATRLFAPYGYLELDGKDIEVICSSLRARRQDYVEKMKEKEGIEGTLSELSNRIKQDQALLLVAERSFSENEERLQRRQEEQERLGRERFELFGARDPDREEERRLAHLTAAGNRRDGGVREEQRLQNELAALGVRIRKLQETLGSRAPELEQLEAVLGERMRAAGFVDEEEWQQARLSPPRLAELSRRAEALQRQELELTTRRGDREKSLALELEKELSARELETLRAENLAATARLRELQKVIGAIEQRLQQHAGMQQQQEERLQALVRQKLETDRWDRLHQLIGSSDGKKFRNFAQGLTFELMVAHANRQLQKMSDRYILIRDNVEPLELNVIDNYQAGEIRSTRNLSGGESFIASLALALGLSSMASRNVRVDSLFLDEGFGTLDEDALETALETLAGLQQDGKLIGIISHVPALKERIGTQIQVDAGNGGRSRLSGPGCRRIL